MPAVAAGIFVLPPVDKPDQTVKLFIVAEMAWCEI